MDPEIQELVKILLESEHRLTLRMADLLANENRLVDDLRSLAEHQKRNEESIKQLVTAADRFIASADAHVKTVDGYVKSADAYVKSSNERMVYMEKQLDAFLRAITGKPMNGKGEPGK